jgi:uncharacterized membrane protein YjjP (DUF1212 family)
VDKSSAAIDTDALSQFLFRLGQAYLACSEQTAKIELLLRRIAEAYGMHQVRVVAFPTAIFISLNDGAKERITLAEGPTQTLRLDQIAKVYELGAAAQRGTLQPTDGLKRLTAIQNMPARFGVAGVIVGHTILSVGLAMLLPAEPINLAAAGILGALVGALKVLNRNRPVLAVPMPVVAAAMVSAIVFLAIKHGIAIEPLHVLVPPLVSFLPGAMLTLGMVELAYGDMVSGSSRLTTGFVHLVLLAFGLAAGAVLVGYHPDDIGSASPQLAASAWITWSPWIGVVVFGAGACLHFSAPRNSLGWLVLVLLLAFAAQRLGAWAVGNDEVSGFFGMLVATPLGYLIQLRFRGPPAMVTFLPTFWLLVPGALSLLSVKRMLGDRIAGIDGLFVAVFALASIALGTLMGAALYKWATETFGWWQLQLGAVGRFVRGGDQPPTVDDTK